MLRRKKKNFFSPLRVPYTISVFYKMKNNSTITTTQNEWSTLHFFESNFNI